MVLLETKIKFLKLTKRPWVRNDNIPNKQRFILLLETKQRFPMLKGTKNAFRIFIVLSETKSALVIKISQLYCLFAVWNSDVFSICFFGQHDSDFGRHDFGRDDCRAVSFQPDRATICSESPWVLTIYNCTLYAVLVVWSSGLERNFVWQERFAWRSFWISASFSSNQSLCFLVERPPTFSAAFWRMIFSCYQWCFGSVSQTGSSFFSCLVWSSSSNSLFLARCLLVSSFFTCTPLFLTAGLILSRTLVRHSFWSVLQSALDITQVCRASHGSFWRTRA